MPGEPQYPVQYVAVQPGQPGMPMVIHGTTPNTPQGNVMYAMPQGAQAQNMAQATNMPQGNVMYAMPQGAQVHNVVPTGRCNYKCATEILNDCIL